MLRVSRRTLITSGALALGVLVTLLLYADVQAVTRDVRHFQWQLAPVVLGLTLLNYALRFLKWQFFLRLIDVSNVSRTDSFLIYLSGFALTVTPAKLGEWLKSYLLLRAGNVPVARSAPVLVAERLTDGLALVVLAAAGAAAFALGREVLIAAAVMSIAAVVTVRFPPVTRASLHIAGRLPLIGRFTHHIEEAMESMQALFSLRSLMVGVGIGVVSWGAECVAFMLVLAGLGAEPSAGLLFRALFILPVASLAGAVLFLPGGLGAVEGGIAGLSQVLIGFSRSQASVAALLIRLATLWFAVGIGIVAIALFSHRHHRAVIALSASPRPDRAPAATDM